MVDRMYLEEHWWFPSITASRMQYGRVAKVHCISRESLQGNCQIGSGGSEEAARGQACGHPELLLRDLSSTCPPHRPRAWNVGVHLACHERTEELADPFTYKRLVKRSRCTALLTCLNRFRQLRCGLSERACEFTNQVAHSSTPCLPHYTAISSVDIGWRGLPWTTVGQSCSFSEPSTLAMGQRPQRYGDLEPKGSNWMARARPCNCLKCAAGWMRLGALVVLSRAQTDCSLAGHCFFFLCTGRVNTDKML